MDRERKPTVERWLREDVVPTFDRTQADPGRGVPIADVRARLRTRHAMRLEDEAVTRDVVFAPEAEADLNDAVY